MSYSFLPSRENDTGIDVFVEAIGNSWRQEAYQRNWIKRICNGIKSRNRNVIIVSPILLGGVLLFLVLHSTYCSSLSLSHATRQSQSVARGDAQAPPCLCVYLVAFSTLPEVLYLRWRMKMDCWIAGARSPVDTWRRCRRLTWSSVSTTRPGLFCYAQFTP